MKTFILPAGSPPIVILLALTGVMFVLQHISPLDPVKAMLGAQASEEAVAARREATRPNDRPMLDAVLALSDVRGPG